MCLSAIGAASGVVFEADADLGSVYVTMPMSGSVMWKKREW